MNDTTPADLSGPESLNSLEIVFVATLSILISIANILMGCELDLGVVVSTVRRPIAPAIGFFTQFVLLPLIAYMVAKLILVPRELFSLALGLFVSGCVPAGGASNFWTLLLNGNVHLSITMTFISMIASIFMIPFWMKVLGYQFVQNVAQTSVKVPYRNIMTSLLLLIVPLWIGIGIAKKWPTVASRARKILRPFIIFVLIFVITFGTLANLNIFKEVTWPAIFSGFLLPFGGFMFGCLTSIILGQSPKDVTAIAIETGVQNTGIAIMILKFSFPDADTSILMPVIVACSTPFPLLVSYGIHRFVKFVKSKSVSVDIEKESKIVSFNAAASSPRTKSPSFLYHEKDEHERPLIKSGQESEAERVAYLERVLDQVVLPGVIPD